MPTPDTKIRGLAEYALEEEREVAGLLTRVWRICTKRAREIGGVYAELGDVAYDARARLDDVAASAVRALNDLDRLQGHDGEDEIARELAAIDGPRPATDDEIDAFATRLMTEAGASSAFERDPRDGDLVLRAPLRAEAIRLFRELEARARG